MLKSSSIAVKVMRCATFLKLPARRPCIWSIQSSGTGNCRFALAGELYFPDQLEDSPAE